MPQLGLKTVRRLAVRPHNSYLIVGAWLLAVLKRVDSGLRHAIWNPILAEIHVQTAKV